MTEEIAWCAGLFEGEGAVTSSGGRRRLAVKMVTRESIVRFWQMIGCGGVYGPYGPYPSSLGKQECWTWVADLDDADMAVALMFPYLSEWRKARIYEL